MDTAAARFWYVWSGVLIGFFGFAWATMQIILALGVEWQVRRLISLGFGFVLFGIAIAIIWHWRHLAADEAPRPGGAAGRPRSSSPWPRSCSGCCGSWARCLCSGSRWWRWHCRRPLSCCSARSITSCGT
jgi:hypothetical protein